MTDRKALADQTETPEDVATLYSWANLHGAKYRDFSASRAQMREKARVRVQEAIEDERIRAREEAETQRAGELHRAAEVARQEELALRMATQDAPRTSQPAPERASWLQLEPDRYPASEPQTYSAQAYSPSRYPEQTQRFELPTYSAPQYGRGPVVPQYAQTQQDGRGAQRDGFAPSDPAEDTGRPAWLASERKDVAAKPVRQSQEDTLQGSRDRLSSHWFALKGVFNGSSPIQEVAAAPLPSATRVPVIAVFSLAGGVGKTSLVATLGRALSARGERVMLIDTAAFGVLPFFFGAREHRPGVLRTFNPPMASGDAPIQMMTVDQESLGPENGSQEYLTNEIVRNLPGVNRVIVDLATASGTMTRRILRLAPTVLVPLNPDMSSVVSVNAIDSFFQRNVTAGGQPVTPHYILNQFDSSLPLHLDVREILRQQLGERLLKFVLRRAPAVSEALAEGMTVVDYAPNSPVAEDFGNLAGWVKGLAAPATAGFRGVRWSEQ